MGRRVPEILGSFARPARGLFGQDSQANAKEGGALVQMCPACLANGVFVAVGAAPSGGLTHVLVRQIS
jgi:hypothetical protein